jgi:hypothetical protein
MRETNCIVPWSVAALGLVEAGMSTVVMKSRSIELTSQMPGSVTSTLAANALIATSVFVHNMVENYMKEFVSFWALSPMDNWPGHSAKTYEDEAQQLDTLLGSYVLAIHDQTQDYLSAVINPKNQSMEDELTKYVVDGSMHSLYRATFQSQTNYSQVIRDSSEKTLWGLLLTPTWRASQDKQTPFLL